MSVAALRVELEREEAVWGLTAMRRANRWERWELVKPLVEDHLPPGTRIRMPLALLPDWYRKLWWDLTQIDGRAEVMVIDNVCSRFAGTEPGAGDLATPYTIDTSEFLDAVLAGAVGDSS